MTYFSSKRPAASLLRWVAFALCGSLFCLWGLACHSTPGSLPPILLCQSENDCQDDQSCSLGVCVTRTSSGESLTQREASGEKKEEKAPDEGGSADAISDASTDSAPDATTDSAPDDVSPEVPEQAVDTPSCQIGTLRACRTSLPEPCDVGTRRCEADANGVGRWASCVAPKKQELCNGKDDDCDGNIDNNPSDAGDNCVVAGKKGPCAQGSLECRGGQLICTSIASADAEVCDGADNDCDGDIDEDCSCTPGEKQPCYSGQNGCPDLANGRCNGICQVGSQTCETNGKWGKCTGEILPKTETCNNQDDNCDGAIDEKLEKECYTGVVGTKGKGLCRVGKTTCAAGVWGACRGEVLPQVELCDGKDNDCDGQADEDFTDKGKPCTVGKGICEKSGRLICSNDGKAAVCSVQAGTPTKEVCDGKDNDCDGGIDEDFAIGTSCSVGVGECVATGKLICDVNDNNKAVCDATPGTPKAELCDGKDNDCDGGVDETCQCTPGQSEACFSGPSSKRNRGACKDGTRTCDANGNWGACVGQVLPQAESCDGLDNDCDGTTDDFKEFCYSGGQGCTQGSGGAYTCIGRCRAGERRCTSGQWGSCRGEVAPRTELCDGSDDDCDGAIDENFPNKGNPCHNKEEGECRRNGTFVCNNGALVCNAPSGTPTAEICDGKDNNCNGKVDEAVSRVCGTNVGECSQGRQLCKNGTWETACNGAVGPKTEKCDRRDNDCDGQVDEICGGFQSYIVVRADGSVIRSRFFSNGNTRIGKGHYLVRSSFSGVNCNNVTIIATPVSAKSASISYECSGNDWRIYTHQTSRGALSRQDTGFHVVRNSSGVSGRVECQGTACTLPINFGSSSFIRANATSGVIQIRNSRCGNPSRPIFATIFGSTPGYIQARVVGNVGGVPTCEFQTFNSNGKPTILNFAFWMPDNLSFPWAHVASNGNVTSETYTVLSGTQKTIYGERWTISQNNPFSHFNATFAAWYGPSIVCVTPRYTVNATSSSPAFSASINNFSTTPNLRVYTYIKNASGTNSLPRARGFSIMYIRPN